MGQRGNCSPTPRATSSNLGPSSSPPHPGFTITLLFQQKGGEGGRKAGVCLAALPPLPSAGPFPSRQETSPDSQPAAALPPPPPLHPRPTESHSAPGHSGSTPVPPRWPPKGRAYPGGGSSSQAPPPGPWASPLTPPRWPHAALLMRDSIEALSPRPTSF